MQAPNLQRRCKSVLSRTRLGINYDSFTYKSKLTNLPKCYSSYNALRAIFFWVQKFLNRATVIIIGLIVQLSENKRLVYQLLSRKNICEKSKTIILIKISSYIPWKLIAEIKMDSNRTFFIHVSNLKSLRLQHLVIWLYCFTWGYIFTKPGQFLSWKYPLQTWNIEDDTGNRDVLQSYFWYE